MHVKDNASKSILICMYTRDMLNKIANDAGKYSVAPLVRYLEK